MQYFRRVLTYVRPFWPLAAATAILTVVMSLIALLEPWPLQILIDNALGDRPLPRILARVLGDAAGSRYAILGLAVLAGLTVKLTTNAVTVVNSYVQTKLQQSVILDFRSDLFQHAERLSLAFHDKSSSGGLIFAINFQANAAAGLAMSILPLVQNVVMLIGMFWISYRIDHQLALLSLTVVPLLYYSVGYYTTHIQDRLREVKGMEGETLSIIHEAMSMLRVIVAFGREDHEYHKFRDLGERARDARVKLTVRQTLFSLAVNMTTALGTALVLGFGAYHALQGQLTVGQLLVVMSYIAAVYGPLEAISGTVGSLQDQFIALQIAFDLLDTDADIKDIPGAVKVDRAQGRVTFEDVSFSYTERADTLKNVSLDVQPGDVIGLVGPTGAGKTTLVSLIPRFYDPEQGRILLDGRDISTLTLKSLRQQVSIVLQEPLLFSGTIADNIRYGRLDATEDEVRTAARAANIHEFIVGLPQKYETQVGERGVQLSGGERQRICVARAFVKDAPILILDEPTSSVDSKTEAVILEALERLMLGRTTFVIAHRLSTILHADQILVLNRGEVMQRGSHEDLLQQDGLYSQLYAAQAGLNGRGQEPLTVSVLTERIGLES